VRTNATASTNSVPNWVSFAIFDAALRVRDAQSMSPTRFDDTKARRRASRSSRCSESCDADSLDSGSISRPESRNPVLPRKKFFEARCDAGLDFTSGEIARADRNVVRKTIRIRFLARASKPYFIEANAMSRLVRANRRDIVRKIDAMNAKAVCIARRDVRNARNKYTFR
jgi:hypothetical protein